MCLKRTIKLSNLIPCVSTFKHHHYQLWMVSVLEVLLLLRQEHPISLIFHLSLLYSPLFFLPVATSTNIRKKKSRHGCRRSSIFYSSSEGKEEEGNGDGKKTVYLLVPLLINTAAVSSALLDGGAERQNGRKGTVVNPSG